ncbi:MAG TPA: hypothetical protein VK153_02630 [Candidatus Paceibacterota bacterium]|nr:hypothetical protein [Candidatus Paceibacterota bacterium]
MKTIAIRIFWTVVVLVLAIVLALLFYKVICNNSSPHVQIPTSGTPVIFTSGVDDFPSIFVSIMLLCLTGFIFYGYQWRKSDPDSGPPVIIWGVSNTEIRNYLQKIYPKAFIGPIYRGRFSGVGIPLYRFNKISFNRFFNKVFGKFFDKVMGYQTEIILPGDVRDIRKTVNIIRDNAVEVVEMEGSSEKLIFEKIKTNSGPGTELEEIIL